MIRALSGDRLCDPGQTVCAGLRHRLGSRGLTIGPGANRGMRSGWILGCFEVAPTGFVNDWMLKDDGAVWMEYLGTVGLTSCIRHPEETGGK